MWDSLKRIAWTSAWISGLFLPLALAPAASAHGPGSAGSAGSSGSGTSGSFQSQTTRPAPQRSSGYLQGGRYRGSRAKEQIEAHRRRHDNRLLVSATGGAANVRPETYEQLGSQLIDTGYARPHVHYSGCGHLMHPYAQQPYVVYLNDEVVEPPVYEDDGELYGAAAQPVQGPIYVVQPQPAPQVVHVPVPVQVPAPTTSLPPAATPPPVEEPAQRPTVPQAIHLQVHPADAQVYLDDEPLGDADAAMASLASLDPGIYVLEVLHESYLSQRLVFGVTSAPVSITIDLTVENARKRARVK